MIDLYTWATPNGKKVSIALEELGLPYTVHAIDIGKGDQHSAEFTRVSPNRKIPAIGDHEPGQTLMESGAILMYLAEKAGRLMPREPQGYWQVVQWLMWQKAGFGPMLGQAIHFLAFNRGKSPYSESRYHEETRRLYGVLDAQLAENAFIAGHEYSIADIATWPWAARHNLQSIDLDEYPSVLRWYLDIAERPAVKAGWSVPGPSDVPLPSGH